MGVTMKEIAYMCGVSRGTVDRVLNGRGRVRPETEERIRSVAKSMGYRSTKGGKIQLPAGKSIKIGLLIDAIDHPYCAQILSGMIHAVEGLADYGVSSITKISGGYDVDQQLRMLDELMAQEVDAIALTAANNPRIAKKLREITAKGIPVALVSSLLDDYEPFVFVGCNHYHSGRIAAGFARQIIPPGSKIAVINGSKSMTGHVLRHQGFMDVMTASGRQDEILEPIQAFDDDMIAYKRVSGLISRHADIDLIFLAAGGFKGVYEALTDADLCGKVKIIAFDVLDVNAQCLKSGVVSALFDQHTQEQGETVVRILSDYLLKRKTPDRKMYYLPVEIVLAESLDARAAQA